MRAAVVRELGRAPEVGDAPEPEPSDGRSVVEVVAAGLNPIGIAVGAGRYFTGHPELPHVPGAQAVARLDDGRLAYLHGDGLGVRREGTFAERVLYPTNEAIPVSEGVDAPLVAACGIAGLAGWLPLAWRAPMQKGETVLVLGATGTVGLVAVQAARLLGARVVAAGRSEEALRRAGERGADATVQLDGGNPVEAIREARGVDGPALVFDPLPGEPGAAAVQAAARGARIVNLGQSAGPHTTLALADVRGKMLDSGDVRLDVETVPLERIASAWERQARSPNVKLVVTPQAV